MAKTRATNPLFEAVAEIFELDRIVHRKIIGKAVADLERLGATPAELTFRVQVHKATWPDCECTANSIVKWWNRMKTMPKPKGAAKVRIESDAAAAQTEAYLQREREHAEAVMAERRTRRSQ